MMTTTNNTITVLGDSRYEVLDTKRTAAKVSSYNPEQVAERVEDFVQMRERIASTDMTVPCAPDDARTADLMADARIAATEVRSMCEVLLEHVNSYMRESLEESGQLVIECPSTGTEFALSTPKVEVSYDLDGLKADRPDVFAACDRPNGTPMDDEERAKLDARREALAKMLEEADKAIAEDDHARGTTFSTKRFEVMAEDEPELNRYRRVTSKSRNMYFRNTKAEQVK